MFTTHSILLSILAATLSLLSLAPIPSLSHPLQERASAVAYYNPLDNGGSMLDDAGGGLGEPLNVIISGLSSSDVLTESGFLNYVRSIGFSTECLGIHLGAPMSANLGDGNGPVNQTVELREDYDQPWFLGTCEESLVGGDHLRVYVQNGSEANSGALFLAVSKEENVSTGHTIAPDGYDVGRNELAAKATKGSTSFLGVKYSATAQNITGLLTPGSNGVNHDIAIDGIVTLLTITIDSEIF